MTKEQYELLVKQNLLARQRAAEMGQVLSSGGVDLSTGQRPAFKLGPIEIGDATDYGQLSDEVLADTAAINRSLIEAAEVKRDAELTDAVQTMAELNRQSGLGNINDLVDAKIRYRNATRGMDIEDLQRASNLAVGQAVKQQAALMPLNQLAGRLAMERILEGSQRFLAFKESQPTAIQNRMATSGATQANLQRATADQARAAAAMASLGAGRRFG